MPERPQGLATIAVHAGEPEGGNAPLTTPIVQSTTYRFESTAQVQAYQRGEGGLYMYSRDENPTVRAAEEAVARLAGAEGAILFASGMGAMTPRFWASSRRVTRSSRRAPCTAAPTSCSATCSAASRCACGR